MTYFSIVVTKYPAKGNLKEKGFVVVYSWRDQSTSENVAATCVAPIVREQ